jgi:hypothetical protein
MLCPSTSQPDPEIVEGQQRLSFSQQYINLEKYFQESCEEVKMSHTIIRIPPLLYTTVPSPYLTHVMESLETEQLYQSFFLSSSLKQKYPFVTLDDLGRGIATILSSTVSQQSSQPSGSVYNLYEDLYCDEEVLPLISQLWNDVISYQPTVTIPTSSFSLTLSLVISPPIVTVFCRQMKIKGWNLFVDSLCQIGLCLITASYLLDRERAINLELSLVLVLETWQWSWEEGPTSRTTSPLFLSM